MSRRKKRFERRLLERRQRMTESTVKEPSLKPMTELSDRPSPNVPSRRDRIQEMLDSRRASGNPNHSFPSEEEEK